MNISTSEDGTFPVIGSFPTPSGEDRGDIKLFSQGDKFYMIETQAWSDMVYIHDITDDPADPGTPISSIEFTRWCPELNWHFSGTQIHPTGDYLYLAQGLRSPDCADNDGNGKADYIQEIWNIKDPANPFQVGTFQIDEVDEGGVTLNGARWEWGPNGLTGIPMTSAGFILYDFSGTPVRAAPARGAARGPPPPAC